MPARRVKRGVCRVVQIGFLLFPFNLWSCNVLAQEPTIDFSAPAARDVDHACIALGVVDIASAVVEVAPWLHAAGGFRSEGRAVAPLVSLGGGLEATFGTALGKVRSFNQYEVRYGPWLGVDTSIDRVRGEGGLSINFGQVRHATFGTTGLRIGAGYGSPGATHFVGVLSWGIRYVPDRAGPMRGACDSPRLPPAVAIASGARLFVALRQSLDPARGTELVFGLEFEPTWFLPPYSEQKWLGDAY